MKIHLKKESGSLVSRSLARELFEDRVLDGEVVDIDFAGLTTISPSFSHEMISVLLQKNVSLKKVNFLNTNDSIKLQLQKAIDSINKERSNKTV